MLVNLEFKKFLKCIIRSMMIDFIWMFIFIEIKEMKENLEFRINFFLYIFEFLLVGCYL